MGYKLSEEPGLYGIAKIDSYDELPNFSREKGFFCVSKDGDSLSVVSREDKLTHFNKIDTGWVCFRIIGPFPFGETGIIQAVIEPISKNNIGVFVVSTFDSDYLLVKLNDKETVKAYLRVAGHTIVEK